MDIMTKKQALEETIQLWSEIVWQQPLSILGPISLKRRIARELGFENYLCNCPCCELDRHRIGYPCENCPIKEWKRLEDNSCRCSDCGAEFARYLSGDPNAAQEIVELAKKNLKGLNQ